MHARNVLNIWGIVLKNGKFTWKGIAALFIWSLLIIPSLLQHWGGKTDYYRGVLAEHRQEWVLAAEYYETAAEDPSAPDIVTERIGYCRLMQVHEHGLELEF